jgi:hypothetical protein
MAIVSDPRPDVRACGHEPIEAQPESFDYQLTATDHVIGALYFSADHGMHYRVQARATIWDHAPGLAVSLVWENGNRTLTSRERGRDRRCRLVSEAARGR